MNTLVLLLILFFGGGLITYFAYKLSKVAGDILIAVIGLAGAYLFFKTDVTTSLTFTLGGLKLGLGFTGFSWLFGLLVAILAPLALIYSIPYMKGRERLEWFYMLFLFVIGAMFGILMARDWVSLFIFWEIMTWSSYLIVIYSRGKGLDKVGLKYIFFSAIGAYALLTAIVIIGATIKSLYIIDTINLFGILSHNTQLLIGILLIIGFGVKAAVMPLHVWAPDAYSSAPMSFTSLFSGAMSKMGVYGLGLVILNMYLQHGVTSVGNWLAWFGAITAVLATFYAIVQDDVKKLLAWSSVAQLGYIVAGIGIGTKLAVFAALFLALLHGAFKGTLFMVAGAVERQAGTTKFSELRALIRKMPYTFLAALIAVIALAGIPPIAGFVGKWMLYEAFITSGHVWVVILLFLASTAAFLYSYRILAGLFLGQEEEEFKDVKEAPALMTIPMLLMALFLLVAGTLPGFVFKPIAESMQAIGFTNVTYQMSVLTSGWGDSVVLPYVSGTFGVTFVVFLIVITWVNHKRTRYVTTKDIHTAGEPPSDEDNYHFSLDFYKPFERAVAPVFKASMMRIYNAIGRGIEDFFQFVRRLYTGNAQTYALYVIIFFAILLLLAKQIF